MSPSSGKPGVETDIEEIVLGTEEDAEVSESEISTSGFTLRVVGGSTVRIGDSGSRVIVTPLMLKTSFLAPPSCAATSDPFSLSIASGSQLAEP
jgi:hypothetical protein